MQDKVGAFLDVDKAVTFSAFREGEGFEYDNSYSLTLKTDYTFTYVHKYLFEMGQGYDYGGHVQYTGRVEDDGARPFGGLGFRFSGIKYVLLIFVCERLWP